MSSALGHFLERSAEVHLPDFVDWFPASFDWLRLCADLPEMARRRGGDPSAIELAEERALETRARDVFTSAHVLGLAVLAAGFSGDLDPASILDRITRAPDEDEEEEFDRLVDTALGPVEERLAAPDGEEPALVEGTAAADVDRTEALVAAVWPAVAEVLLADPSGAFQAAGPQADLLLGLARVAVVLAAFRWISAERHVADWPRPDLDA